VKKLLSLVAIFLVVILQTSLVPNVALFGVFPNLLFVFIFCWCLIDDFKEASIWAVAGGMLLDLFSLTSFGLSSLTFLLVVAVLYFASQIVANINRFYSRLWLCALASMVSLLFMLMFSFLFNVIHLSDIKIEFSAEFFFIILGEALLNVLVMTVIYPLVSLFNSWVVRFEGSKEIKPYE
jgi:rod shape-determining protein MreD